MLTWLKVLAPILTALALIPVGAHLFELPNKIGLGRDAYFTVQKIYAGWSLFGFVLVGAMVANLALAAALRRDRGPALLAAAAASAIAASLVVFFAWTEPVNQATANWTTVPADWQRLKLQWELSHAANAGLIFTALVACSVAVATAGRRAANSPGDKP